MFQKRPIFKNRKTYIFSSAMALLIGTSVALRSQTASQTNGTRARTLIHGKVDESKLVTLAGNTRPEATAENDLGAVSDDLTLDHMMLQLKRSPQQEQAVEQLVAELHNPQSPSFHKWLTASDFGKNYGLAESDVKAVTSWLEAQGFVVNSVYPNGMLIDFSGNAGQVRRGFHTTIHHLSVDGVQHIANFSDPQIPEALGPAVAGVVSLHDFMPHKMSRAQYTFSSNRQTVQALVPADLATIYDFNPLFAKGTTGSGQTIAVLEDTDLYQRSDWVTFRSTLGLSQYTTGTLTAQHPASSGINNCSPPGVNGDDSEAALDAEWASAAAPGAAIVVAACADTATFGGFIAMQNLVNGSNPPAIVSLSYGMCEVENGVSSNASINALYQQAVAEGISVFVSAGDEGAASCDSGASTALHGITVSSWASTPYNVAVGGTDFSDVLNGATGKYWNLTTSTAATYYGSALSYIPEIPWNSSCAGALFANYMGYSTAYGSGGFCSSVSGQAQANLNVEAASGGPSNCATGAPSIAGVASGSCAGYAKPSWQAGLSGIPSDGVRDIPDVSMFAAVNSFTNHFAIVCYSDEENGGTPCTGAPSNWIGFGGTSLATPIMAGIQALVNQSAGGKQGNPNPVYYALAAKVPSVFHTITQGDIDVDCAGPYNCYGILGTVDYGRNGRIFGTTWGGALSASNSTFSSAYAAGGSYSLATGIGSVDAFNLVTNWSKGQQ
ncbi:MAG TPA: S53 family peptidase [Bryobacteraceae bacterium]|jgi:subtilase family serine protease